MAVAGVGALITGASPGALQAASNTRRSFEVALTRRGTGPRRVVCQADGPLRRPAAPAAPATAAPPPSQMKTMPPPAEAAPPAPPVSTGNAVPKAGSSTQAPTIEFQRQRAKELTAYFQSKKYEEQVKEGRVFGWTRKNEISNGRWSMFGLAVGLLTEYATGVNFPDQLKIIVANLGIADIDF